MSKLMDKFPDAATISTFDHQVACGLVINWSLKGVGFGEVTIARRKDTGKWHVDDEETGVATTRKIIAAVKARLEGRGPGWQPLEFGPGGVSGGKQE